MIIQRFSLSPRLARLLAASLVVAMLVIPVTVSAAVDPFQGACTGTGSSATVCADRGTTNNPLTGPNGVLTNVTNILAAAAGIIGLIFIIWAGIKYITANGDSAQISQAKKTIIYALVGLVVVAVARPLINFVLSRV